MKKASLISYTRVASYLPQGKPKSISTGQGSQHLVFPQKKTYSKYFHWVSVFLPPFSMDVLFKKIKQEN